MNKYIFIGLLAIPAIMFVLNIDSANGQVKPTPVTDAIEKNYTRKVNIETPGVIQSNTVTYVQTMYESPTTVVIYGDLIVKGQYVLNSQLWEAMDMVKKQFGYRLQQVITNGEGSEGNPTTIYLLMVK